jgi:hypothetical protein
MPLCPTCVAILREMCRAGGRDQPQLCEIEARYVATGDESLVAQAAALNPGLAWKAVRQVRADIPPSAHRNA